MVHHDIIVAVHTVLKCVVSFLHQRTPRLAETQSNLRQMRNTMEQWQGQSAQENAIIKTEPLIILFHKAISYEHENRSYVAHTLYTG